MPYNATGAVTKQQLKLALAGAFRLDSLLVSLTALLITPPNQQPQHHRLAANIFIGGGGLGISLGEAPASVARYSACI